MVAQQNSPATPAAQKPAPPTAEAQQASTAADAEAERPTLNAGVIWLSTPLDPVESGWVTSQSGMSENLFRLSTADLSPEPMAGHGRCAG